MKRSPIEILDTATSSTMSTGERETNGSWFNPQFDQALGESLIRLVQNRTGCFTCGSKGASKTCSRCRVAKYCDPKCQKSDWSDNHKLVCKTYCDNRKARGAIPILLVSIDLISEQEFMDAMHQRRQLFLNMVRNASQDVLLTFQVAVIDNLGFIRLMSEAKLLNGNDDELAPHLLIEPIEESGGEASRNLYIGSGTLSPQTKERVVKEWVAFADELVQAGLDPRVTLISLGRGFQDWVLEFKDELHENGYPFHVIPSPDYVSRALAADFENLMCGG